MNSYDVFVYFFYALDYVYDMKGSEKLGDYLSGANPFLFEGNGSADPAVYDEFEKAFKKEFKTDRIDKTAAYNWLKKYTVEMKNDAVKEAFETITLNMWLDAVVQ